MNVKPYLNRAALSPMAANAANFGRPLVRPVTASASATSVPPTNVQITTGKKEESGGEALYVAGAVVAVGAVGALAWYLLR